MSKDLHNAAADALSLLVNGEEGSQQTTQRVIYALRNACGQHERTHQGGLSDKDTALLETIVRGEDPEDVVLCLAIIARRAATAGTQALGFPRPADAQERMTRKRDIWRVLATTLEGLLY